MLDKKYIEKEDTPLKIFIREEFNIEEEYLQFFSYMLNEMCLETRGLCGTVDDFVKRLKVNERTINNWRELLIEKQLLIKRLWNREDYLFTDTQLVNPIINSKMFRAIRQDCTKYINPLYKNDKCEICGKTKELHLHHKVPLSTLINMSIEELKMSKDNLDIDLLRYHLLEKQINEVEFATLCKDCHLYKVHKGFLLEYEFNKDHPIYVKTMGKIR